MKAVRPRASSAANATPFVVRSAGHAAARPVEDEGSVPVQALPLATLVLDSDGRAVTVNAAWHALFGGAEIDVDDWPSAVDAVDEPVLLGMLRHALAQGTSGQADVRLIRRDERRWSRWWWQPCGPGSLTVCVADIGDDKQREADLWQRATHDPLTGLLNRSEFLGLVDGALRRGERRATSTAVVFLDLDGFKAVNDAHGHRAGDRVLCRIASELVQAVRPNDAVARVGGDEFAVLCEELHDLEEAHQLAGRMRETIERSCEPDRIPVAVSIGVAVGTRHDRSAEDLLARADEAMYAAKRTSHVDAAARAALADTRSLKGRERSAEPVAMAREGLSALERHLRHAWADECADPTLTPETSRLQVAARLVHGALVALDPHSVV